MDWQGIEGAVPIFELSMIVLPIYAFIEVRGRVKNGSMGRTRAVLRYAAIVIAPVFLYVLSYGSLIGFEELTSISVVTEGLARTYLLLIGLGFAIGVVSLAVFGAALLFMKLPQTESRP